MTTPGGNMELTNALPWGDMPYDNKTPREVIDDYVLVRGDLGVRYAREQLATWIERYAAARLADAEAQQARVEALANEVSGVGPVILRSEIERRLRQILSGRCSCKSITSGPKCGYCQLRAALRPGPDTTPEEEK